MNSRTPEKVRILHLLKIGIFASLPAVAKDLSLVRGVSDPAQGEILRFLTRYLHVFDLRIITSDMQGLFGIPVVCLCARR